MTQAYPLTWPANWPRTKSPGRSQFKTSLAGALNNVHDSIRRFVADSGKKVEGLVISSNYTLAEQKPADAGVAVYFTWDGLPTCICVDRYQKLEDNLQAIHHVIEAERTKLRHGGLNLVRAAFRGYAALPPPPTAGDGRPWRQVLGEGAGDMPLDSLGNARTAYNALARKHHPDRGGDANAMAVINAAWEQAQRELAA